MLRGRTELVRIRAAEYGDIDGVPVDLSCLDELVGHDDSRGARTKPFGDLGP